MNKQSIPFGFCQCGCGRKTNIAQQTDKRYGHIKGQPINFINGHNQCGEMHPRWKGGRRIDCRGYWVATARTHKRAYGGRFYEHILIWEKFHNKEVPKGHIIHHINGVKTDNRIENLVAMSSKHHDMLIPLLEKRIRDLECLVWKHIP